MPRSKYTHASFAFTAEDKEIPEHCAEQSGLSQTEIVRRLTRHYAGGGDVTSLAKIKTEKRAKARRKSHGA